VQIGLKGSVWRDNGRSRAYSVDNKWNVTSVLDFVPGFGYCRLNVSFRFRFFKAKFIGYIKVPN